MSERGDVSRGSEHPDDRRGRLRELAGLFLRLGSTSFGGPAAHIALMEHEVVTRRGWVSHAEFLDMLAATNLIPGPNSTEMALHLGQRRAGMAGLLVAGACFIGPAMGIALLMAWIYVKLGHRPEGLAVLAAVKPVLIPVIARALVRLGASAVRDVDRGVVALLALGGILGGLNELLVLVLAGGVMAMRRGWGGGAGSGMALGVIGPRWPVALGGAAALTLSPGGLFLVFLKIGAVLYGSGYVLLAFLRADLVARRGWMTEAQLLDAVAIGQVLPGPLFTTATFVGYILGGLPSALSATAGIFLPAFVLVAISGPLIPRLRRSRWAGGFLDGVTAASLALMVVVTWQLARAALDGPAAWGMAVMAAIALARYGCNPAILVVGGALAGFLMWGAGLGPV